MYVAEQQQQQAPSEDIKEEQQEATIETETPTPLSEFEAMQAHLTENRHDASAWNKFIDLAEESGDLEKIKQAYESLLQAYPNTAEAQIAYLEHYMHPGLFPTAEALFNRFLRPSPSVQLWKFYLSYVRRMNSDPSTREMVSKAYDFALLYIGQDKDSGEIWKEYLDFVKSGETHNTWEEQQKMDALRRIYQRAVQIPLEILEQLWSEYNAFEIGLNKLTARKFIQDMNNSYMTAKEALKQLRMHLGILFPPPPNFASSERKPFYLPEPTSPNNDIQRSLAKSWRTYLQWEEKNPLDIEDKVTFNARMLQTYKKAVIRMRFNPETWFMAYSWTEKHGKAEDAVNFLKSGLEANPASFVLNFAYAEHLENAKNYVEVHNVFNKFIEVLHGEIEKVEKTVVSNPVASNGSLQSTSSSGSIMTPQKELATRRRELGIAWIAYMRFARRAEGLKPARTVFGKARKDKWISWEVYEAAASMEYHFTKATDVATRIYETGMKQFGEDAEYVHKYLKFLISINDENNARALFERVIGSFTPEKARPVWEIWTSYEYNYGDLSAADKLEKRMAEVYPDDNSMRRFAQRHMYSNHDAIAVRDLGWMPPGSGSSNGSVRNESSNNLLSTPTSAVAQSFPGSTQKRPASPERSRPLGRSDSQDMGPPPPKRAREMSPPPPRRDADRGDRGRGDRERREPPPSRRRYGSPPDRNRGSPPRRGADGGYGRSDWERETPAPAFEDRAAVPSLVGFFLSQLPTASSFDGPIFRVDDLMQVFRNATIPASGGQPPARARSPPPPARDFPYLNTINVLPVLNGTFTGRPPPDYGPYQGPSGGGGRGGGRRY
ncbi:hypothetical protein M422DRAFT_183517 [Sphaerobolus stellatus SS14]|uniref:mRNA 3'-end-processing protein RNA14 n=1 Tax=Sphaerobolus stellatus (strain SS14) TaxID=990650 RepID=A0A0C9TSD0_SPHS4|nr:hypothetical protein M422DRAFT_183517 [Sphaerobolus stellatus SS14]